MAPDYRRLRDLGGRSGAAGDPRWAAPPPPPPGRSAVNADRTPPYGTPPVGPGDRPPRDRSGALAGAVASVGLRIRVALVVGALAVIGLVVALIVVPAPSRAGRSTASGSSSRGPAGTGAPATGAPTTGVPTTVAPTTPAPTTAAPTTTAAPSGPGPALQAISPAAGHPGQQVTMTGVNLASANGTITVMFGAVQAGVSCPSRTTCVATVPPQPGGVPAGGQVPVTLGTTAGTSKAVPFTYR